MALYPVKLHNLLMDHSRDGCEYVLCRKCGWHGWSDSGCLGCEQEKQLVPRKIKVSIPIWIDIIVEAHSDSEAKEIADEELISLLETGTISKAVKEKDGIPGVDLTIEDKGGWDTEKG